MMVILEEAGSLAVHRVGWFDRFSARIRASRLDRELARGASPEADVPLALRAQALAQPSEAARLAAALERIVVAADPSTPVRLRVPVNHQAVRAASIELRTLVDRLRAGSVDVRSIATIRNLVGEGSSPLYRLDTTRDLRAELVACIPHGVS